MNFWEQLKYRFQQFNIAEKIILINVLCFVLPFFLKTIFYLFNQPFDLFLNWFDLSSDLNHLLFRPWTLVTYSFLHSGFFHLFWNMVLLYFSGRLFLNLFGDKLLLNTYFLGVLIGGGVFVFSYLIFPVFQGIRPSMVGASAGVMAVFIFVCSYTPDQEVRMLFFNVKLRYLGIAFVLLDIIQIPTGNAGGHLAHIGGAALGFFYVQQLRRGSDIGAPFENFFKTFTSFFTKKKNLRTVYKANHKQAPFKKTENTEVDQKRIDSILDKIGKSGYESLSKEEKDFLFTAGKD